MKLLVIGGSIFVGRHLVAMATAAGHQVTTLNRGTHDLPEQRDIERLITDREGSLGILQGRSFDAVIDTCGYQPQVVRNSVMSLAQSVRTYAFISTVSAYGEFPKSGMTEHDPIKYTLPGNEGNYGTKKADCEKLVNELMPDRTLIIRPGLIVGPYDPTDRFTYWPKRVAAGGKILAPGRPDRHIQFIDVRDLAAWILALLENEVHGTFNATGESKQLTMGAFLEACAQKADTPREFVWIKDQDLLDAAVEPWSELPLWIPESDIAFAGFVKLDCRKAFDAGLRIRPVAETIADTLAWDRTRDPETVPKAGLDPNRERELLSLIAGATTVTKSLDKVEIDPPQQQ